MFRAGTEAVRERYDRLSGRQRASLRRVAAFAAVLTLIGAGRFTAPLLVTEDSDTPPLTGRVAVGLLPDGSPDPLAAYLRALPADAQVNGEPAGPSQIGDQPAQVAYRLPARNPESIPVLQPRTDVPTSVPSVQPTAGPPLPGVAPSFSPDYFGPVPGSTPTAPSPAPNSTIPYDPTGLTTDKQAVVAAITRTFPADQVANAVAVARCESGIRSVVSKPNRNGSRDWGVFQLNDNGTLQGLLRVMGEDTRNLNKALDPEWNVRAAYRLYQARGWQPWTCAAKLGLVNGLWSYQPGPAARR